MRRGRLPRRLAALLMVVLVLPMVGLSRSLITFIPDALVWFSEEGAPMISPDETVTVERDLFTGEIKSAWDLIPSRLSPQNHETAN